VPKEREKDLFRTKKEKAGLFTEERKAPFWTARGGGGNVDLNSEELLPERKIAH